MLRLKKQEWHVIIDHHNHTRTKRSNHSTVYELDGSRLQRYHADSSVEAVKAHVYITVMISDGRILR